MNNFRVITLLRGDVQVSLTCGLNFSNPKRKIVL